MVKLEKVNELVDDGLEVTVTRLLVLAAVTVNAPSVEAVPALLPRSVMAPLFNVTAAVGV